jgi:hypothetical protein
MMPVRPIIGASTETLGPLARSNKAIDFQVSDRTVVGNTSDVLYVLHWILKSTLLPVQFVPGCTSLQTWSERRISGVVNYRDGLLCIVKTFPVPGTDRFFVDSTFHRTGIRDMTVLRLQAGMAPILKFPRSRLLDNNDLGTVNIQTSLFSVDRTAARSEAGRGFVCPAIHFLV